MVFAVDWAGVAQQVVAGLSSGGIYAILAVAFVLIYRATGVVNFAQGELAMFSTFVAWTLTQHGFGYWPAFVVTMLASSSRAYVLEVGRVAVAGASAELQRHESVRRSYLGY